MLFAAMAAFTASAATPTPEVTSVTMRQSTTSRLVTIEYTLDNAPAVVTLDVETNANTSAAADDPGWTSIGGEGVSNAEGDVWKKVGTSGTFSGRIEWRPDLSWPGHKILGNGARAVVTAWALDNTPDYMAVDISNAAQPNTQKYYPSADYLPGGLLANDAYRKSMIVMRKIMAKGVKWTMGSVGEGAPANGNEATHQVALTNNYYIGVFEVTQAQWLNVTGYNNSNFTADRLMRPVERVSYNDIREGVYPAAPSGQSFIGLLQTKTEIDFDLPSETQWEFAARAGHGAGLWGDGTSIQIVGSSDTSEDAHLSLLGRNKANPATNQHNPSVDISPEEGGTSIVGSYRENDWGIYDMHGNVGEVCLDFYTSDITSLNGSVNTSSGTQHVERGGTWQDHAYSCRPAARSQNRSATERARIVGFRLVCTAGLQ